MIVQVKIQVESKSEMHRIMTHLEARGIDVVAAKMEGKTEVSLVGKRASQFGHDQEKAETGRALRLARGLKVVENMDLMGLKEYARIKGFEKETSKMVNSSDVLTLIKEKVFNI